MSKVAVIVLDGMSFEILDSVFQKGLMPYLKSLSDNGTNLKIQTDIPLTSSAWAAMVTGKAPFESGFNDARSIDKDYNICKRTLATKTIWDQVNEYGKKVGIYNAPYIDPVPKVDGFMVTGKAGPSSNRDFGYPYNLKKELFDIWKG